MTSWSELVRPLQRFVAQRGVNVAAEEIPADRSTVYRLCSGETVRPTQAIKAGVERLVKSDDKERE